MMMKGAQRHFERNGYDQKDAALKASTVIAQASADPTFAKLIANTFDQEQMLRNDLTAAQLRVGAMEAGAISRAITSLASSAAMSRPSRHTAREATKASAMRHPCSASACRRLPAASPSSTPSRAKPAPPPSPNSPAQLAA